VLKCAITLWANLEIDDDDELMEISIQDISHSIKLPQHETLSSKPKQNAQWSTATEGLEFFPRSYLQFLWVSSSFVYSD